MSVHCKKQGDQILILGNTYPHREAIKRLGAVFNPHLKIWQAKYRDDTWSQAKLLCESLGGAQIGTEPEEASLPRTEKVPPSSRSLQPAASMEQDGIDESQTMDKGLTIALSTPIRKTPIAKVSVNSDRGAYTVSEVLEKAASVVAMGFPGLIWIQGEVQNLNFKAQAVYFHLAEGVQGASEANTTTISASLWGNTLATLIKKYGREPLMDVIKDGLKIKVLASLSVYKGRASLSLSVQDIDLEFTKGDLALNREKLLKELRAKGLDQKNKQKMFPSFPLRVGLISASGSRALGDFIHQLEEGRFPGEIVFLSAPMQGEDVPLKLPGVFLELQSKNVDLIVLTRGGGSMADLRWFDAREVAMAIANCPVPVIAAIGHQDDLCVAEEISFLRAKTPTAAAEVLLSCFRTLRERLGQITHQLAGLLEFRAHQASLGLANLPGRIEIALKTRLDLENERLLKASTLMMHGTFQQIHRGELRLDEAATRLEKEWVHKLAQLDMTRALLTNKLDQAVTAVFHRTENELLRLESALAAKDPAPWIDMGWTRLEFSHDPELKLSLVKIGDELKARLKTSLLHLEVKEVIDKSKPIGTQKN